MPGNSRQPKMPSEVSSRIGVFDKFAGIAAHTVSRAPFFAFCVLLVLVWFPSRPFWGSSDTWQLVINTTTTIITFLMVALLQNTQTREDQATQHKLNAIADGLADLMDKLDDQFAGMDLSKDVRELKQAVGLEERESTSRQQAPR